MRSKGMETLTKTLKYIESSIVGKWLWRLVLYPLIALALYSGTAYLNSHYVTLESYGSNNSNTGEILEKIDEKLDTLIAHDAAKEQQGVDIQRRLNRVEDKIDSLAFPPPFRRSGPETAAK